MNFMAFIQKQSHQVNWRLLEVSLLEFSRIFTGFPVGSKMASNGSTERLVFTSVDPSEH